MTVDRCTLSVVVPTFNNAAILEDLLISVAWADEVVFVDSGSSDNTQEVALASHPRVVFLEQSLESFATQRNFGMDHATMDYVFHCDSDEVFPAVLSQELLALLKTAKQKPSSLDCEAWNVVEKFYWFDKRLSFLDGPWGGRVKFHRRGLCRFKGRIHETMDYDGPVSLLRSPIIHRTSLSINQSLQKYMHYSDRQAMAAFQGEARLASDPWSIFWRPLRRFLGFLFIKRAYKDGLYGALWAGLQAISLFLTLAKLWSLRHGGGLLFGVARRKAERSKEAAGR